MYTLVMEYMCNHSYQDTNGSYGTEESVHIISEESLFQGSKCMQETGKEKVSLLIERCP